MQKQVICSLIAATAATILVAGCGGGGGGSYGGGSSGGGSSGGPVAATSFFVTGKAATTKGTTIFSVPFADANAATDPYALVAIDPNGGMSLTTLAKGGTWLPLATVVEWTASGGNATAWAPRYRVFAQTDGSLWVADLGKAASAAAGSTPPAPTPFSTVKTGPTSAGGNNLCSNPPLVLGDYASPWKSWVVFRVYGVDNNCGTADDKFIAIPMTAGASTAPTALDLVEPVETVRNSSGAITGVLEIKHNLITPVQNPPTFNPPTLWLADASLANPQAVGTSMAVQGLGLTVGGGSRDFMSLGVAATSQVWLYRDLNNINAIALGSPATVTTLFTLGPADFLQGDPALFDGDGRTAYVAVNTTVGSRIVRIDTGATPITATTVVTDTAASIQLVGLTSGGNIVYSLGDRSGIRFASKSASNTAAPTTVTTLTPPSLLDAVAPVVVGDRVYYTVYDSNLSGLTPKQAYYAPIGASPTPVAIVGAAGGSAVIAPVYASSVATGAPAVASVLVATGVGAAMQTAFAHASIVDYSSTTGPVNTYGTLPTPGSGGSGSSGYDSVSLGIYLQSALSEGPLQVGMPALLEVSGNSSNGYPAFDVELIAPGTSSSPTMLTSYLP